MPETLNLNYYYGNEADQYSFYRIPKILLTDRRYKGVSLEAKVLYGLLLDRMGLSARNGWLDDNGRVFLYFTQEEVMAMLDCGKDKATKLFRELEGIGLVERKKQGQGHPARIYVRACSHKGIDDESKIKKGQKDNIEFVITGENAAESLETAKKSFNLIALFV